jgi:dolichol-phosphate mannosyltransferase
VFRPRSTRYAVVIPVWNEGEKLLGQLARMREQAGICDIVIADAPSSDGSTDPARLAELGVHALVALAEPGGQSSSLRTGFAYALRGGYDGIIEMDGNGKDDPEALPRFVAELEAGAGFVQGSRYLPGGRAVNTPPLRQFLIRRIHAPLFSLLAGHAFTDTTNGFRAYARSFLCDDRVRAFRSTFRDYELVYYLAWIACRGGFRVREIPVTRAYPAHGPTPTKIRGLRRYGDMLKPLLMLALRRY